MNYHVDVDKENGLFVLLGLLEELISETHLQKAHTPSRKGEPSWNVKVMLVSVDEVREVWCPSQSKGLTWRNVFSTSQCFSWDVWCIDFTAHISTCKLSIQGRDMRIYVLSWLIYGIIWEGVNVFLLNESEKNIYYFALQMYKSGTWSLFTIITTA